MDAKELARLVQAMRSEQKRWFRDKDQAALTEAKRLERDVDRACVEVLSQPAQASLF